MERNFRYTVADEGEVDELLAGKPVSGGYSGSVMWERWSKPQVPRSGSIGIFWQDSESPDQPAQPLALIANDEDVRRLCGRYAQLRGELSPLSAWCHLMSPRYLESLDSPTRKADLGGMEAAWTGLAVAEAVLLVDRPISAVRIAACLATRTYATARTKALWNHISTSDIANRFDAANNLCRNENGQRLETRAGRVRSAIEPIWEVLAGLSEGRNAIRSREMEPIVEALYALRQARLEKSGNEAGRMVRSLLDYVPEASQFEDLEDLAPEVRLRLFDKLVLSIANVDGPRPQVRRNALCLLAGYLATVAAGGAPSLALAEEHTLRFPEITAWAYTVGGVGENVVWTSSFDGLGRLVARELSRPFRLDEPPSCDFSFDEANVLVDPRLSDPLVNLRVKQARLVTVALFPGVNVSIPLAEQPQSVSRADLNRKQPMPDLQGSQKDLIVAMANALWPHLEGRVSDLLQSVSRLDNTRRIPDETQRYKGKRKSPPQSQLPLNDPKKYGRDG